MLTILAITNFLTY